MEEGEEVYLNAIAASEADVGNFSSRVDPLTLGLASALNAVTLSAGLTCNLLVMVTVWRSPSLTASSINRAVMSLCLADLVCVAAEIPLAQAVLVANFRGAADSSTFGRICAIQVKLKMPIKYANSTVEAKNTFSLAGVQPHSVRQRPNDVLSRHRRRAILFHQAAL